jgi:hypothetical protein
MSASELEQMIEEQHLALDAFVKGSTSLWP